MSKNFELLHNLTNEKELFQTLETWEDVTDTAEDAEPDSEANANQHEKAAWRPSLPDVFQAVKETLGPLSPLAPDFIRDSKPSEEPVEEETEAHGEKPSRTFEDRFPISRNPITPLNSISATPGWAELEAGSELGSETESELGAREFGDIPLPEALRSAQRASSSNSGTIQEPPPFREEKAHQQVQTPAAPGPRSPATASLNEKKSSAETAGRKVQARRVYKDAKRELIAREEEFKLVQRIFLGGEQSSPRIVLFSGIEHERGCASICVRAGELLAAQAAGDVCIVDADLRSPSLHQYFGVQNDKGLAEAVLESGLIQDFAQQLSPANLWLIPGGYGASQLNFAKAADRLRARMEELREAYRYVLVHSGPLWLNANAMLLSKWTDGVVLILEANSTRRDTARRIKESLAVANAKVLGVVLNNRSYPIPESLYSRL